MTTSKVQKIRYDSQVLEEGGTFHFLRRNKSESEHTNARKWYCRGNPEFFP
jgi:hypothetical protein